jgi:hypothetical protein
MGYIQEFSKNMKTLDDRIVKENLELFNQFNGLTKELKKFEASVNLMIENINEGN